MDTNWDFRQDRLDAEERDRAKGREIVRRYERMVRERERDFAELVERGARITHQGFGPEYAMRFCSAAMLDGWARRDADPVRDDPREPVCTDCERPDLIVGPNGLCHECEQSVRDMEDDCRG